MNWSTKASIWKHARPRVLVRKNSDRERNRRHIEKAIHDGGASEQVEMMRMAIACTDSKLSSSRELAE